MDRQTTCVQCGGPASSCQACGSAYCDRLLCSGLHAAACSALSKLPSAPDYAGWSDNLFQRLLNQPRMASDGTTQHLLADQLLADRAAGRQALAADELTQALDALLSARTLERGLERGGADLSALLPPGEELETDLVPLARALSARNHPRYGDVWRHVLADRVARSVQVEAAEWLAREAFQHDLPRIGLRVLHAASALGGGLDAYALRQAYQSAGLDADAAFTTYLIAARLDHMAARALDVRDPLTGRGWADQDPRWWLDGARELAREMTLPPLDDVRSEHRWEAINRARDLAMTVRDDGWVYLAEGDFDVGPNGPRALGRLIRSGTADPVDHELLVRIRIAYENSADRLPDNAWPWYRLAELVASAGFLERATEYLAQAERRSMGDKLAERHQRPRLRALVLAVLDPPARPEVLRERPFPIQPYGQQGVWRLPSLADVRRFSGRPRPEAHLAAQVARHLAED